jgi:hypothetical protein
MHWIITVTTFLISGKFKAITFVSPITIPALPPSPRLCRSNIHRFYICTAFPQPYAMVAGMVYFRLRAIAQVHFIIAAAACQA